MEGLPCHGLLGSGPSMEALRWGVQSLTVPTGVRPHGVRFGPQTAGPWGGQAAALGRQGGHWLLLGPVLSLWYQPLEGIPWRVLRLLPAEDRASVGIPGEACCWQPHVPSSSCLVDERPSSSSGDTMSDPSAQPSSHRGRSWNHPSPAHARYCPFRPPSPTLCPASGPVRNPVPTPRVLGALGSAGGQPAPRPRAGLGCGRRVLAATCGQRAWPQTANHVALS